MSRKSDECVCHHSEDDLQSSPISISVHVDDYLTKLVEVDSVETVQFIFREGGTFQRNIQLPAQQMFDAGALLQTVKTGEPAVRGTMEPVSKSKSIRVCVMVLTLLVEEPVPIWRS